MHIKTIHFEWAVNDCFSPTMQCTKEMKERFNAENNSNELRMMVKQFRTDLVKKKGKDRETKLSESEVSVTLLVKFNSQSQFDEL